MDEDAVLCGLLPGVEPRQRRCVDALHTQLIMKEPLPGPGRGEMHLMPACDEQLNQPTGVDRSRGAGDPNDNPLVLRHRLVLHVAPDMLSAPVARLTALLNGGFAMLRLTALIGLTLTLTGCVGYTTYPPPTGSDTAINSPNVPPAPDVIVAALRRTIVRHRVSGDYAVNLPPELTVKRANWIVSHLDDPHAHLLTASTQSLPTYHVARIWIRGNYAEVDVFHPVMDIPGPAGAPVVQLATVTLRSNLARWRMESIHSSRIGAAAPPPLHFVQPVDSDDDSADEPENGSDPD